jgi:hypothetical protein
VIGYAAMVLVGISISTVQDVRDRPSSSPVIVVGLLAGLCVVSVGWVIQRRATVHVNWQGLDLHPWPLATWTWKNITWIRRTSVTRVEFGYRLRVQILTFVDAASADGFMAETEAHAPSLVPIEATAPAP